MPTQHPQRRSGIDRTDYVIPIHLRHVFDNDAKLLDAYITSFELGLRGVIADTTSASARFDKNAIEECLAQWLQALRNELPFAVCRDCEHKRAADRDCACRGTGWLTEGEYDESRSAAGPA
jgi:hypothetical protein